MDLRGLVDELEHVDRAHERRGGPGRDVRAEVLAQELLQRAVGEVLALRACRLGVGATRTWTTSWMTVRIVETCNRVYTPGPLICGGRQAHVYNRPVSSWEFTRFQAPRYGVFV